MCVSYGSSCCVACPFDGSVYCPFFQDVGFILEQLSIWEMI